MNFEDAKQGYLNLWNKATIRPERLAAAEAIARKLEANRSRYEAVAQAIGCPWYFVAIIHNLESGADFRRHLHNGDPLTARTRQVPKGRPVNGKPPFTWEVSALDALRLKRLNEVKEWSTPRCLYEFERYNGWGYLGKVNSPYVWSFTTLYDKGKYVRDHVYDPNAVSQQCGAAAIMKAMLKLNIEKPKETDMTDQLRASLSPLAGIAPTLISALAGPAVRLAVRALADALGTEATSDAVRAKAETVPLGELVAAAQKAEETLVAITPAAPPIPAVDAPLPVAKPVEVVPVQPVEAPPLAIDKWLPKGWKTIVGISIYCAGVILATLGYVTPETGTVIQTIGGGLIGVTLKLMLDRWLPLFAGFLKPKSTETNEVVTR